METTLELLPPLKNGKPTSRNNLVLDLESGHGFVYMQNDENLDYNSPHDSSRPLGQEKAKQKASDGSKGVQRIETLLKGLDLDDFSREKRFTACKDSRTLPFDFIIIVNGRIGLIEYDGAQHFQMVPRFHASEEDFVRQQNHDIIKNRFTRDRNISLCRISYLEDAQIEKHVTEFVTALRTVKKNTRIVIFSNSNLYCYPYGHEKKSCAIM